MGLGTQIVGGTVPRSPGRSIDVIWPKVTEPLTGNVNSGVTINRGNSNTFGGAIAASGTGSLTNGQLSGMPCAVLQTNAAADKCQFDFGPAAGYVRLLTNTSPYLFDEDPTAVWDFGAILATNGLTPAANRDFGMQFVTSGSFNILANGTAGIGLQFIGANIVQFITQGQNGLKTTQLTAAPFDLTQFHHYKIRIVGSTKTNGVSRLEVWIDGMKQSSLPATQQSWAAGSDLPAPASGQRTFEPVIINSCGLALANQYIAVHRSYVRAAPSVNDI